MLKNTKKNANNPLAKEPQKRAAFITIRSLKNKNEKLPVTIMNKIKNRKYLYDLILGAFIHCLATLSVCIIRYAIPVANATYINPTNNAVN